MAESELSVRPQPKTEAVMRLVTSLLMAMLFVIVSAPSAVAGPDVSTGGRVEIGDVGARQPVVNLLEQALALVRTLDPATREDAERAGQAQSSNASGGDRKKWLTIGLIGVGTAVAGVFVYEKTDSPLPGIHGGREVAGQGMIIGGAVLGGLGLWHAFNSD